MQGMFEHPSRSIDLPFNGLASVLERRHTYVPSEEFLLSVVNSWIEENPHTDFTFLMKRNLEKLMSTPNDRSSAQRLTRVIARTKMLLQVICWGN